MERETCPTVVARNLWTSERTTTKQRLPDKGDREKDGGGVIRVTQICRTYSLWKIEDLPTDEAYYETIVALNLRSSGLSVLHNTNTRVLEAHLYILKLPERKAWVDAAWEQMNRSLPV
ncbi:hypothetical protein IEQ34_011523 [Dendrobium chrysotoxum]|uniref:Uncharacterized protein n=1 Tax=Dendrobium chrysotoxum TaxID=161865 RepID=A0AAV7GSH6_DENCH|nr:hypothetical protein IEQ34_011523 [Dendrobium chrysotoxum]